MVWQKIWINFLILYILKFEIELSYEKVKWMYMCLNYIASHDILIVAECLLDTLFNILCF